jgi:hypothetical protein
MVVCINQDMPLAPQKEQEEGWEKIEGLRRCAALVRAARATRAGRDPELRVWHVHRCLSTLGLALRTARFAGNPESSTSAL